VSGERESMEPVRVAPGDLFLWLPSDDPAIKFLPKKLPVLITFKVIVSQSKSTKIEINLKIRK